MKMIFYSKAPQYISKIAGKKLREREIIKSLNNFFSYMSYPTQWVVIAIIMEMFWPMFQILYEQIKSVFRDTPSWFDVMTAFNFEIKAYLFQSTDLLPSDNLKSGEYFQVDFDKYPVKFAKGTSLSCDNLTAVSLYVDTNIWL